MKRFILTAKRITRTVKRFILTSNFFVSFKGTESRDVVHPFFHDCNPCANTLLLFIVSHDSWAWRFLWLRNVIDTTKSDSAVSDTVESDNFYVTLCYVIYNVQYSYSDKRHNTVFSFQVDILVNNAGVTPVPGVHLTQDNLGTIF